MTDILTRLRIQILGEDDASDELRQLDQSAEKSGMSFNDLANQAAKLTAGLAVVGKTIQEAFELGEEGAQVRQTAESIDLLLTKVNAAPGLLAELQAASKGTIDDMSLMSSTATSSRYIGLA